MRRGWRALAGALLTTVLAVAPAMAADSDGDGLADAFERRYGLSSPATPDTDRDGVVDSAEDSDRDGLSDRGEQLFGSDPTLVDSDGDGTPDADEDGDDDGRVDALEQDQRPVPADLRPSLARAEFDMQPSREKCQSWHGQWRVKTCGFGDRKSSTHIVLAGDSHATMWLTPLKRIARQNGWRLTTMTKRACPALLGLRGNNQWEVDRGRTCDAWQKHVLDRLDRHPVDMVIFAHTPGYKLRRANGQTIPPSQRPIAWRNAVRRTVARLPAQTVPLLLGGVPRNFAGEPVRCLQAHPDDISACVTRRQPEEKRTMDVGLRQGAARSRALYATMYDYVCPYDPCPVIQGDTLLWRDGSHISETFARKLQRPLERILIDALTSRNEGS